MTQAPSQRTGKIAFQGTFGAFSDMSCRAMFPKMETVPSETFEDAFRSLENGDADLAMIAVDNSLAGRVADVHHLLPQKKLFIIGEHFQPVVMCLMGLKGSSISGLTDVYSHTHALPQCRKLIKELGLKTHIHDHVITFNNFNVINTIASNPVNPIPPLALLLFELFSLIYFSSFL